MTTSPLDLLAPAWDLSSEYPDFDSEKFTNDLTAVSTQIENLRKLSMELEQKLISVRPGEPLAHLIPNALSLSHGLREARRIVHDLYVYSETVVSVDATNETAKRMTGLIEDRSSLISSSCRY